MYFVKTPPFIKTLFSDYIWNPLGKDQTVYLTFDDGPVPEATPWILDLLAKYEMKATFFCVGDNVMKNKDIYYRIIEEGHGVGNHTFNHLNGWKTDVLSYKENIDKCHIFVESPLFRPPYGKLTPKQTQVVKKNYSIVMWDILSGDFDMRISPSKCIQNVLNNYENGSIIVFHDSIKTIDTLKIVLPTVLQHFKENGIHSENLNSLIPKKEMSLI